MVFFKKGFMILDSEMPIYVSLYLGTVWKGNKVFMIHFFIS